MAARTTRAPRPVRVLQIRPRPVPGGPSARNDHQRVGLRGRILAQSAAFPTPRRVGHGRTHELVDQPDADGAAPSPPRRPGGLGGARRPLRPADPDLVPAVRPPGGRRRGRRPGGPGPARPGHGRVPLRPVEELPGLPQVADPLRRLRPPRGLRPPRRRVRREPGRRDPGRGPGPRRPDAAPGRRVRPRTLARGDAAGVAPRRADDLGGLPARRRGRAAEPRGRRPPRDQGRPGVRGQEPGPGPGQAGNPRPGRGPGGRRRAGVARGPGR